ncbi:MAG TPA: ABC transporter substrate-binding protein [Oligoflexus sp.]|uniref:ABC transporter substrate-binding protein n=1 Tax=Oligoflexus sp. TaxID=1971216 RepID=UPI002D26FA8C|nr:ABC transporter substrate-binding protein [Oligoflexus sp.]HYX39511.1 ABC transporter substrate-binding protein [Oligoflexus sp.]
MKAWNPTPYWAILIACFVCSASSSLIAKPAKDHVLYRIGFIHPRSGPLASYGNSLSQGVKLGLTQFRSENPQLAEKVALIAADDRGLASEAEKAALRLVQQQKADILIGSLSNVANQAIAAVSSKTNVILLLPRGTEDDLTAYPYVYSMSATDKRQGRMLSQFALKSLRRDRAAVLVDARSPDSEVIGKSFAEAFTQGGGQMLGQWSEGGSEELKSVLTKIASAQPNIVVFPGSYRGVPNILTEARKAGVKATFVGGDGWDHVDLYKQGDLGSQYYFSYFHNNDPQAGVQSFVTEYETTFGQKPDVFAALGYDAVRSALQAFVIAKSAQTPNLQKTFEGARFPSIYGAGHFGKDHVFLRPYPVMITTGGQARLMSRVVLDE